MSATEVRWTRREIEGPSLLRVNTVHRSAVWNGVLSPWLGLVGVLMVGKLIRYARCGYSWTDARAEREEGRYDRMSRMIAGGLVGIAVVLAVLGSALWIPHAIGGAVATAAALLIDRSRWWAVVPWLVLVVVFVVAWW